MAVNGQALPRSAVVDEDSLTVGRGSAGITLRLRTDRATNRRLVLYDEHLASSRWRLDGEGAGGRRLFVVNASDSARAAAGTLPLIELDDWPLGPRAAEYAGVLEETGGAWWWRHAGVSSRMPTNALTQWPSDSGARMRGHIVRLGHASLAANPILAITILWIAGALVLAFGAGAAAGVHPGLRVGLLGLAYTLTFVRRCSRFVCRRRLPSLRTPRRQ